MANTHLFEVPYNFSLELLDYYTKYREHINFIFLPPYKDDSPNTRSSIETTKRGQCYMPNSREEYEFHLHSISSLCLRYVVLWQSEKILTRQYLEYYGKLGASGFIIADDRNARIIKEYNPNLLVVASLVQRLCIGILQRDFRYYDYILLYYPFNRSLDCLHRLDRLKDKLVLMPNTFCHIDCPSIHHWFPSKGKPFDYSRDCMARRNVDGYINKCGLILPEHLYLFDSFVSGYKLEGREYSAEIIKNICDSYFERKSLGEFKKSMLDLDVSRAILDVMDKTDLKDYYNSKTSYIIDLL